MLFRVNKKQEDINVCVCKLAFNTCISAKVRKVQDKGERCNSNFF